ncbi:MAG: hypothetical protein AAGJ40_11735 [Planctomycetota bacterium]
MNTLRVRRHAHRKNALVSRCGISLIETIACMAIVGSISTGVVSIMRNSARMAAHTDAGSGAPALARGTLRAISEQVRRMDIASTQPLRSSELRLTNGGVHRFSIRAGQSAQGGRDLVSIDPSGLETVWVSASARRFDITRLDANGDIAGLRIRLELRLIGDEAARQRPEATLADVTTTICLTPQQ